MSNFTPEDLLLYLYNEMDAANRAALEQSLEKDWTLREKLGVLKTSMQRLDRLVQSPRTEVILDILRYAAPKQTEVIR
jgi:predicted Ser/Thr protein kinase